MVFTGVRFFFGRRGFDGRGVNRVFIIFVSLLFFSECIFRVLGRVRVFKEISFFVYLFIRFDCFVKVSFGMFRVMMCTC